ncbi:MAG: sulfite exporter TauE/SafE family protein, partial [Bacteroidota bacterium]
MLDIFYLILIGFIAGVLNTLAGGGSLLTLPLLIFLGLPPNIANGT